MRGPEYSGNRWQWQVLFHPNVSASNGINCTCACTSKSEAPCSVHFLSFAPRQSTIFQCIQWHGSRSLSSILPTSTSLQFSRPRCLRWLPLYCATLHIKPNLRDERIASPTENSRQQMMDPYVPKIITTIKQRQRPAFLVNALVTFAGNDLTYASGGLGQHMDQVYSQVSKLIFLRDRGAWCTMTEIC